MSNPLLVRKAAVLGAGVIASASALLASGAGLSLPRLAMAFCTTPSG